MPKSSKKKKDKVADFTKAKLKLGKGKQPANNSTNTSFKARSITIPHQAISEEKDASKPTTRRNLALDDLLSHLKHYNPNTRKDAIWGLRELLEAHPQLIQAALTPTIQMCARLVGDEDTEVRKALLTFFTWFCRIVPLHQIRPHIPLLILFIASAQTNIFPAIRIDAIHFLDVILDLTPDIVTQGWSELGGNGFRILDGYLSLLCVRSDFGTGHKDNPPTASTSTVTLSTKSRLVVLSSLGAFLQKAISPSSLQFDTVIPTWYMASSFSSHAQYRTYCSLLHPYHSKDPSDVTNEMEWSETIRFPNKEDFVGNFDWARDYCTGSVSLDEIREVGQAVDTQEDSSSDSQSNSMASRIALLAHTLHPILISTWLDVAPSVFTIGGAGGELETQLAVSVARIAGCLYGAIFRENSLTIDTGLSAFDDITALLGYMSTYLPCDSQSRTHSVNELMEELSLAYCELTSLAVLASRHAPGKPSSSKLPARSKQSVALSTQVVRVAEYVISALDGETVSHPLRYSLTASAYAMLLPTIWSLLQYHATSSEVSFSARIRSSCIKHALRISSNSGTKIATTQFVGMLLLLHSQRRGPTRSLSGSKMNELECYKEWYQHLPRVLWELGVGNLLLTEIILRLLLRITQCRTAYFDAATNSCICARLVPYFAIVHVEKGEILGPFTKLREWPRLRRLALDVAAVFILDGQGIAPLRAAVDTADLKAVIGRTTELQFPRTGG